ncbi:DUF4783 domain-containing protein [Cecembia sp.]|uniref:DUF4783 domain-containing protein n=1 Tax=Cecembia sp. TaxID=1898110 RepID=UPI0025C21DA7|nr:DUF4783 domain-containing protein [Cecembia sp.]
MKKFLYIGLILFILFSLTEAKSTFLRSENVKEDILHVFQSGSSKELARFFENGVDININGNQGDYSRNQAELVMRDFFKKYPPVDFQLLHEGKNAEQIVYYIGVYKSEDISFKVFIRGKKDNEAVKFYSLDIVKS